MIGLTVPLKIFIVVTLLVELGISEEAKYEVGFNEGFSDCKDYTNKIFDASNMQLAQSTDDGEEASYLEGYLELFKAFQKGYVFEILIAKITDVGSEPMWSCTMDLCQSLDDDSAPWYTVMQDMGINGCPIETDKYYCKNMTLDMSFMKDKLSHEFAGCYDVMLEVNNEKMESVSCHKMGMCISESEDRK